MPRHARSALILATVVSALAFFGFAAATPTEGRDLSSDGGFEIRLMKVDPGSSERSTKHRPALLAAVLSLLSAARLWRRNSAVRVGVQRATTGWWLPCGERAPPPYASLA